MEWKHTKAVLEKMGDIAIQMMRNKLNQYDPYPSNATYRLYNSITTKVVANDSEIDLKIELPDDEFDASTGNLYIDQGRQPGKFPPSGVIEKWMIAKGITPQYTMKKSAYLIGRKIKEQGIKPGKNYINEIRYELQSSIYEDMIREAVKKDIMAEFTKQTV